MKRLLVFAFTISAVLSAVHSCGVGERNFNWEKATLEEKLEHMRSDSSWIHKLDSNVLISAYVGFQSMTYDEFVETARTQFDDQPFVKVTSFSETEVRFRGGHVSKALEMETRTDDGIIG